MEDKIRALVKEAKEAGAEVEVHTLKVGKQKEPEKGYIHFDFEDNEMSCEIENVDFIKVSVAINHVVKIIAKKRSVAPDQIFEMFKGSHKMYEAYCEEVEIDENVS